MTHINAISCGQGAPSLFLIVLAGEGFFPVDFVQTADTGWENDMLWTTGERTTSHEFFERVTKPLANSYGFDAAWVRSVDKNGVPYDSIPNTALWRRPLAGSPEHQSLFYGLDIPLYGSDGGRLKQSCTSKWKMQAMNQELRRRGADTATTYLGLHRGEVHRLKPSMDEWRRHAWPLVNLCEVEDRSIRSMNIGRRWNREEIGHEMDKRGIPYLVTTECDGCPNKDLARWRRTSPETIRQLAEWEQEIGGGEFFLCVEHVPLRQALELKELKAAGMIPDGQLTLDMCDSGYCFI